MTRARGLAPAGRKLAQPIIEAPVGLDRAQSMRRVPYFHDPNNLRHSREMTRVCSRNLTQRPAFGGDDNAFPTCGLRIKVRRFWWVTLSEHKWVILGERRGQSKALTISLEGNSGIDMNQPRTDVVHFGGHALLRLRVSIHLATAALRRSRFAGINRSSPMLPTTAKVAP